MIAVRFVQSESYLYLVAILLLSTSTGNSESNTWFDHEFGNSISDADFRLHPHKCLLFSWNNACRINRETIDENNSLVSFFSFFDVPCGYHASILKFYTETVGGKLRINFPFFFWLEHWAFSRSFSASIKMKWLTLRFEMIRGEIKTLCRIFGESDEVEYVNCRIVKQSSIRYFRPHAPSLKRATKLSHSIWLVSENHVMQYVIMTQCLIYHLNHITLYVPHRLQD